MMSSVTTVNFAKGSQITKSASYPGSIRPFLLSSLASLAGPTAISLITSWRVKPRFLASVHINGKANWTEEIPPQADIREDFDTSFKSGVDGEWSDTTKVTTFFFIAFHNSSLCQ